MSTLEVNKITPQGVATEVTLGDSGDTFTVPTGVGVTVTDEVKTNKISPASGTSFTMGDSGDTFTIPSGVTLTNNGTASGFGGGKVLQVVSVVASGWDYNNTMVDGSELHSGATITPSATSSKVLVLASFQAEKVKNSPGNLDGGSYYFVQINRGGTNVQQVANALGHYAPSNSRQCLSASYVDSPSTTSATTYKLVAENVNGGGSSRFIGYNPTLTLVEIGA